MTPTSTPAHADHVDTDEGAQEMTDRSVAGGVEVLRELGCVLRMSFASLRLSVKC